ncbi:MAG: PD-(D/E)XK nuclease family protein [Planctomycetota bacterium]
MNELAARRSSISLTDTQGPMLFVDWKNPLLPTVATWLVDGAVRETVIDLSRTLVVLPGARSGRRLLELLIGASEARGLGLVPPRLLTPQGLLPALLERAVVPSALALASPRAAIHAWQRAMLLAPPESDSSDAHSFDSASPDLGATTLLQLERARRIQRTQNEITAQGFDFATIAAKTGRQHWHWLTKVEGSYHEILASAGLIDPARALHALASSSGVVVGALVLVGIVDLAPELKRLLATLNLTPEIFVHAPVALQDDFDSWGCLVVERWTDRSLEFAEECLHFSQDPREQAGQALELMAKLAPDSTIDDVTIGFADPDVIPDLREALASANVPHHAAPGSAVSETAPWLLVARLADFLEHRTFASFGALARHPYFEAWLLAGSGANGSAAAKIFARLAEYHERFLPRTARFEARDDTDDWRDLARIQSQLESLCTPLLDATTPQPPQTIARNLADVLAPVYAAVSADELLSNIDARSRQGWDSLLAALEDNAALPSTLTTPLTSVELLRWLLRDAEHESIAEEAGAPAVEIVGWLELPLDDAPHLLITGMSDQAVPGPLRVDPHLPESVRRQLGLPHHAHRHVRDAYYLHVLKHSRRSCHYFVSRTDSRQDPLAPSRLVLGHAAPVVARRLQLFHPSESPPVAATPTDVSADSVIYRVPAPQTNAPVPARLSVTALRDYLACPYRYYLRHVLRLRTVDDDRREFDAAAFGRLAHEVLNAFGVGPVSASCDQDEIAEALLLDLRARMSPIAANSLPAVRLQQLLLEQRLRSFATWQARHRQEGWRIVAAELEVAERLLVGGREIELIGRIDRIDRLDDSEDVRVYDYKTADRVKSPDQRHRRAAADGGREWIDLQLPLYARLVRTKNFRSPELGYLCLSKDENVEVEQLAKWNESDLQTADATLLRVLAAIGNGVFWPPSPQPPRGFAEYAPICMDGLLIAGSDDELADDQGESA